MATAIEHAVYRICEKFITCTPGEYREYKKIFHDDKKIMLVTNGHELTREQLKRLPPIQHNNSSYKIVCMGKFLGDASDGGRDIEKLYRRCSNLMMNFHIYFLGTDEETINAFRGMKNIIFLDRMPYNEAIEFIADADLSIAGIRDESMDFGTKVFDYIALGIPIYDWFDHKKDFYKYFYKYLFNNIRKDNRYPRDFQGKFSREKAMGGLCDLLKQGERY